MERLPAPAHTKGVEMFQTAVRIVPLVAIALLILTNSLYAQDNPTAAQTIAELEAQLQRQQQLAKIRLHALQIRRARDLWESGEHYEARRALLKTDRQLRGFEYSYLDELFHANQQELTANGAPIRGVGLAISADGKRLVAHKTQIHVWNVRGFRRRRNDDSPALRPDVLRTSLVATLEGNDYATHSVAISRDGNTVAVGTSRGISLWNVEQPTQMRLLDGHKARVVGVDFYRDDQQIVSTSSDGVTKIWDVESGQEIDGQEKTLAEGINCTAMTIDRKQIAVGGNKGVTVWDVDTGIVRRRIQASGEVLDLSFSPDGQQLLCGTRTTPQLWDLETGELLRQFHSVRGMVHAVCLSHDGKLVAAAGGYSGQVAVLDAVTGEQIDMFVGQAGRVEDLAFYPGDRQLLCSSSVGTQILNLRHESGPVQFRSRTAAAFSHDSKFVATIGLKNSLELRTARTGEVVQSLGEADETSTFAISPKNQQIALATKGHPLRIWHYADGSEIQSFSLDKPASRLQFSPDGGRIFCRHDDGELSVWSIATGKRLCRITHGEHFASSPNGELLVGCKGTEISIHNAENGKQVRLLDQFNQGAPVSSLRFSPDGNYILGSFIWMWATGEFVKVWHVPTGEVIFVRRGKTQGWGSVPAVWNRASDQVLRPFITKSGEEAVGIWDPQKGNEITTLIGHTSTVTEAEFFAGGERVASIGRDGKLRIWDTVTGQELLRLSHRNATLVDVSPNGQLVMTSNSRPVYTHKIWKSPGLD